MNTQKQIILIVALFFTFVGSCAAYSTIDLPIRSKRQSDFFKSESVERGALLFANNCRTCHGIVGQGGAGLKLNGSERDWQNQDPLVLASNKNILRTTLYCGRAGTLMPAWLNTNGGSLNARQIDHLIDFITSPVSDKFKDEDGNPTSQGWVQALEFAHNLNRAGAANIAGDTLAGVAKQHHIAYDEMSKLNDNKSVSELLPKGYVVRFPDSYTGPKSYKVEKTNETLAKIIDTQSVGAAALASFNKLKFSVDKKGAFTLLGDDGKPVPGMFPGDVLAMPEGAVYVVHAGDTVDAIAKSHGLSTSSIVSANRTVLGSLKTGDPIPNEFKLQLPSGAFVLAGPKDTLGIIATAHGLKPDELAKANNLDAAKVLAPGDKIQFPSGAGYLVSTGDTISSVATAHNIKPDDLARLNNLKVDDRIGPDVLLQLPKVDKFTVTGQSLEDVNKAFGGATADDFAKANGLTDAKAVLRIGQALKLPPNLWGPAPPDAKNPGTACVEHAVPEAIFPVVLGTGGASTEPSKPDKESAVVSIQAHANDWTVNADGAAQPINQGAVTVKAGTAVEFKSVEGLHTITINGKKDEAAFQAPASKNITFKDTGKFAITCDFHPAMKAWIYVQ